jgi:hypothetical protein
MFHTRFLDQSVRSIRAELAEVTHCRETNIHRSGGRDSAWLSFLKRYLAHRIYTQPNLHPLCPEYLIHRAADWLSRTHDNSETAKLRYFNALCQVGFWENFCCVRRRTHKRLFVDDSSNYIDSTTNPSGNYDGEAPLKQILLETAIFLGEVDMAKKVYALKPKEGYYWDKYPNSETYLISDHERAISMCSDDRTRLSVLHGGLEMFKLVCGVERGIKTNDQYRNDFGPLRLMKFITTASSNPLNDSLINLLIGPEAAWDRDPYLSVVVHNLPYALVNASSPEIFQRLIAMLGPEVTVLTAKYVEICCGKDGMIIQLDRSAAADNLKVVKYLIDHGGALYLNNTHTDCESPYQPPGRSPWQEGYWKQWQMNPLVRAVEVGNADMVKLMLVNGADPNHNRLNTPLMAAVRRHHLGIAKLLLEHGADVNLGSTPPVVLAVRGENVHILDFLLENGAIIDTPETGGKAMGIVENDGLDSIRNLLRDKGVKKDAIWNHVQTEEEFVLTLRYPEIQTIYSWEWEWDWI